MTVIENLTFITREDSYQGWREQIPALHGLSSADILRDPILQAIDREAEQVWKVLEKRHMLMEELDRTEDDIDRQQRRLNTLRQALGK